jgi:AraC family transcriptional regulator, ethanolamine operon transcriptional activator
MDSAVFHDFESFAASLRQVDMRIMLTYDRGQRWRTQIASLNQITIHYGLEGGGIICEGAANPDVVTFFLPMKNSAAITCNGAICDDNSWLLQYPGREFYYNVTGPNEWVSLHIPMHRWTDLVNDSGRLPSNQLMKSSPKQMARLRNAIWRFMAIDHGYSRFLEIPSIQSAIEDEILSAIVSITTLEPASHPATPGRPAIPRDQVLQRAKRLIEQRPNGRLPTSRLAFAAGVSERTLRSIFREYYGVAPLRYLKLRQLHLVRSALKKAGPESESLKQIAEQFGIWEVSRFAQHYRRLFGESPWQTLRES